jgi:hypothetical protein
MGQDGAVVEGEKDQMRRVARSWMYLVLGVMALVAAGCSDRPTSNTEDATPTRTDATPTKTDATPTRTDATADAIDCSLVGCAAPPPCGQACTEPCGCCPNPACFGDAGTGDKSPKESGADLGPKTACGPSLTCASATEICVESGPVGPSSTFACKPVPSGCTANRTCACVGSALCTGAFNTCHDVNTPNVIYCECPGCQ